MLDYHYWARDRLLDGIEDAVAGPVVVVHEGLKVGLIHGWIISSTTP